MLSFTSEALLVDSPKQLHVPQMNMYNITPQGHPTIPLTNALLIHIGLGIKGFMNKTQMDDTQREN